MPRCAVADTSRRARPHTSYDTHPQRDARPLAAPGLHQCLCDPARTRRPSAHSLSAACLALYVVHRYSLSRQQIFCRPSLAVLRAPARRISDVSFVCSLSNAARRYSVASAGLQQPQRRLALGCGAAPFAPPLERRLRRLPRVSPAAQRRKHAHARGPTVRRESVCTSCPACRLLRGWDFPQAGLQRKLRCNKIRPDTRGGSC